MVRAIMRRIRRIGGGQGRAACPPALAPSPRTRTGEYDYKQFVRALGRPPLCLADFERPARMDGDIEITSTATFVIEGGSARRLCPGERL
jgi:hypothetical protein